MHGDVVLKQLNKYGTKINKSSLYTEKNSSRIIISGPGYDSVELSRIRAEARLWLICANNIGRITRTQYNQLSLK